MKASKLLLSALALALCLTAAPAAASGGAEHPRHPRGGFSFEGPFGTFNQRQLQRGFKVYKEVCSACHSLSLLSFRDLGQNNAPFWFARYKDANENPYVKAIAGEYDVNDLDT